MVGATHETAAQIEAAAGLATHPPLLDIQTGAEAKGIERLPWVRSASVSVHWPDGVRVVGVRAGADAGDGARPAGSGPSWTPTGGFWRSWPRARPGSSRSAGRKPPVRREACWAPPISSDFGSPPPCPPSFRAQVTAVTVVSAGFVQLAMTTPILVDIGDATQLHAKYEDVSAALAGATLHDGDIIDVSVPGAMTVTGP